MKPDPSQFDPRKYPTDRLAARAYTEACQRHEWRLLWKGIGATVLLLGTLGYLYMRSKAWIP